MRSPTHLGIVSAVILLPWFLVQASAAPLPFGVGPIEPDVFSESDFANPGPVVADTSTQAFSIGSTTGIYRAFVERTQSGSLDFFYTFSLDHQASGSVESVTFSPFGGVVIYDAGYLSATNVVNPLSMSRSASGDVITFTFPDGGVGPSEFSPVMALRTNATLFMPGEYTLNTTSGSLPRPAFAPVPAPGPWAVSLAGVAFVAICYTMRRRLLLSDAA